MAKPDKNSDGVEVKNFPTGKGGKKVYPDNLLS